MMIHINETTKKELPQNVYEISERGYLKISDGVEIKTWVLITYEQKSNRFILCYTVRLSNHFNTSLF